MKIKVCGISDNSQLADLDDIGVDMIGRIFYPDSPRSVLSSAPAVSKTPQVGVFVDADTGYILKQASEHFFQRVQLHGHEGEEQIEILRLNGIEVIKAIAIGNVFPTKEVDRYVEQVDLLLFDTKGISPGGNGLTFDWRILAEYKGDLPFLLSGGIGPEHVESIRRIIHPSFLGVDINSGFEIRPGYKDLNKIKAFIHELRS